MFNKITFSLLTLALCLASPVICTGEEIPANIRLTDVSLMHELRATPCPDNGGTVTSRKVSFQWPLAADCTYADAPKAVSKDKSKLKYKLRYSTDANLKKDVTTVDTKWPFYNPDADLKSGKWYWQHGYVMPDGSVTWSPVFSFSVEKADGKFVPPAYKDVRAKVPATHPRVYIDGTTLDAFRTRNADSPEAKVYTTEAEKVLKTKMKTPADIKTGMAANLKNKNQIEQMITRESRRIIDREEKNLDILMRAYILTKDERYATEAISRVSQILDWTGDKNIAGDFNHATFMSIFSTAYDLLNDHIDEGLKTRLLDAISAAGKTMYARFSNNLENRIADNHVWQMTLRIFTMGTFSVLGDLPEAEEWAEYAYNVWLARFPGLNTDGAWHNGDSYFGVNFRTLTEVPYFYSRISGFDFFSDPWYQGNALYTIYQQPLYSHAGGQGSAHGEKHRPYGSRIAYADVIARMTGNTYLADYARYIHTNQPKLLLKGCTDKSGGLAWLRMQIDKPLPEGPGMADMPMGYVFPETGLASFITNLQKVSRGSMLTFRSSPYGSTSHALANQNAFNTYYGGDPIFYSSGHHTSFVDRHALLCERSTRAHNTILVDGMGQRIGVEGYGWMPRYYVGEKIGYLLGDASNAYGPVTSSIWKKRAKDAEIELSPENGWDEVGLKTFRRHIIQLGKTGITVIYDELEAEEPREWSYLLHTVTNPMELDQTNPVFVRVTGTAKAGQSDAFLFSGLELRCDTTSRFFAPADNWLKADANGNFEKNPDHWHFTATTPKSKVCRLLTLIHTHAFPKEGKTSPVPQILKNGAIKLGRWNVTANLSTEGAPSFFVKCTTPEENVSARYDGEETTIIENGDEYILVDEVPQLEI